MAAKNSAGVRPKRLATILIYAALILFGTIFTLPFFWLISTSFKPSARIQKWPPDIVPIQPVYKISNGRNLAVYTVNGLKGSPLDNKDVLVVKRVGGSNALITPEQDVHAKPVKMSFDNLSEKVKPGLKWSNYSRGLRFIPFTRELYNTLIISLFSVIGTILSCSLVAYGLAKIEWKCRNTLFIIMLSTMMLPAQVTMIPVFAIFVKLGWIDTFLPLIVPTFLGSPFFIFLLRQFFLGIPKELSEAARFDGCNEFQTHC
jgi:ABC-type glycerol-3-phosphate transport system permease component